MAEKSQPILARGQLIPGGSGGQADHAKAHHAEDNPSIAGAPEAAPGPVSMISTAELTRRPSRPPDYAAENRALVALAQEMASAPHNILQKLTETGLTLCRAHSAGFSLLEDGDQRKSFHWRALVGQWASHVGGEMPRDFGPCGMVLDRNAAMLCSHPERDFPYLSKVSPLLDEGLLIPLYVDGEAVGTIWVISHDETCRFDAEDLRVMTNLGTFAGPAYKTLLSLDATIKAHRDTTRLNELGGRLTETSDLPSILYEILDGIIELQKADFGDVQLYDEATGTLKIVAHRGLDQRFLDYFANVDAGDSSACGLALRSGARFIIEDVNADPDFAPHRGIAASMGFRAVQSTPLLDRSSGKPLGMLSTHFREPHRPSEDELRFSDVYARQATDVLASRLAERALRESEARLSAILNQVPGAVGMFDRDGKFVLRGGPLGALWDDIIPSRDAGALRRWRSFDAKGGLLPPSQYPGARALRGETLAPSLDFIHTAEDGREIWIRCSAAPFRDETGEIVGGVSILQDVDQEKRAQQQLHESEARLQAAVDLVKLGRYAWNPQTNELQWDGRLRAMWGLPAGAPIDYEVWRAGVHPDDLVRVEAAIQQCVDPRGDGVYDIEYRVIGKNDGVQRWIATRGRTNFENNEPVSFYGVALDITDRKRIEETLERRIEARTHELEQANRQLRAQIEQREIVEAEVQQLQRLDAIGQITSGVAHDFNNLLSVVLTNARLLSHSLQEPDEGVELIRTAAERGVNLVRQLLAFSRRQRLAPQGVDLNSKITGMNGLLTATLGGTVQLRTVLAPDLWPAMVDPTQIELVILNLVINARDAMPSGGSLMLETRNAIVDSRVGGTEGPVPGQYVVVLVSDSGAGIPDHVLPHVFEPFFTTKHPGKNSGLGLAQVVGFVKQSGGGIGIETRVGKGTSVKVFLPRAEVVRVDHGQFSIASVSSGLETPKTILVVDDDAAVLKTTLRLLASLGYSVVPALSGGEALQLLDSHSEIDLILADYAMPTMSGAELARTIKTTRPALPVILITGYGNREVIEGFNETRILQKPYTEDELILRIGRAINEW
ncbi:GAF domain-containing protein [Bradyrhizobium sp. WSM3983]|uniref:GAF domain-containing protein n=1 Tax=Bradyrhizobium sp. WSM3983 TaxID=1038867 RepID=UPI000420A021|nr:GAF domain-containing protein [Bradyrhizobium sp. WSM3983]